MQSLQQSLWGGDAASADKRRKMIAFIFDCRFYKMNSGAILYYALAIYFKI